MKYDLYFYEHTESIDCSSFFDRNREIANLKCSVETHRVKIMRFTVTTYIMESKFPMTLHSINGLISWFLRVSRLHYGRDSKAETQMELPGQ
jgi:hypothetical protein